jgi:putative membrane protein
VDSIKEINVETVSKHLLEELGEAVLALLFPDMQQKTLMDFMLGGEGSKKLAAKHRWIAYSYLQNGGNPTSTDWNSPTFKDGMLKGWDRDGDGTVQMMGGPFWWGILVFLLIFGILVLLVALFVKIFKVDVDKAWEKKITEEQTPLSILKQRYAKGEITKEEFLEMKEILLEGSVENK